MTRLDVGRLAAALNDAQIQPQEIRLGHDLMVPAERIVKAYGGRDPGLDVERLAVAMSGVLDTTTRRRVLPYVERITAEYQRLAK